MDTILLPLLDGLRESLGEKLAASMGGETCALAVVPGTQVIADWCTCGNATGCGGMAWVRLDSVYSSSERFPSPDGSTKTSCAVVLAAVIEVGVLRCVPKMKPQTKTPPSPAEQTQAALVAASDALAMARAITCYDGVSRRPSVLGRWSPRDSGDCGGGAMTVTVKLVSR